LYVGTSLLDLNLMELVNVAFTLVVVTELPNFIEKQMQMAA